MSEKNPDDFSDMIAALDKVEKSILSGDRPTVKKVQQKKELRYRISTPENERLILTFEDICSKTQRVPRAVVFNLIDQWVRDEGAKLYGADEIARKLEGE